MNTTTNSTEEHYWGKGFIDGTMVFCQLAMLAMMLLVVAEVAARLLGFNLELSEEFGGYLLVTVSFLSLAGCAMHNSFHQVELFTSRLSVQHNRVLMVIFILIALATSLILDYHLINFVIASYVRNDLAPTLLETPLWIPRLVMPLGITLLCMALVVMLLRDVKRVIQGAQETQQ